MKFTAEELFNLAYAEYLDADFLPDRGSAEWHSWKEGVGEWALASSQDEFISKDAVREELRGYIAEEKAARE